MANSSQIKNANIFWGYGTLESFVEDLDTYRLDYDFLYKDKRYWIVYEYEHIHIYCENPDATEKDPDYYKTWDDIRYKTNTIRDVVNDYVMHDGVPFLEALKTPGAIE